MAIENPYYGPNRPKSSKLLPGILFAPFKHATPIRILHAAGEALHIARKHGKPVVEVFKGHRRINEIAHDKDEFLNLYRTWSTPDKVVQDPATGRYHRVSLITEWARWNSENTLRMLGENSTTKDIPDLAVWLNGVLDKHEGLIMPNTKKQEKARKKPNNRRVQQDAQQERSEWRANVDLAFQELKSARGAFARDVVHDATLAAAEKYYDRIADLHIGTLVNDLSKIGIGVGSSLVTAAALVAIGLGPEVAIPLGAVGGVLGEIFYQGRRRVKIMSEDGQQIEGTRYKLSVKGTVEYTKILGEKVDNLLRLVQIPSHVHASSIRDKDPNSPRSLQRSGAIGSALIATMPNYYQLVHRLQAYSLFNYFLPNPQNQQKH